MTLFTEDEQKTKWNDAKEISLEIQSKEDNGEPCFDLYLARARTYRWLMSPKSIDDYKRCIMDTYFEMEELKKEMEQVCSELGLDE